MSTGGGAGREQSSRDREQLKGEQESGQRGELSVARVAAVKVQGGRRARQHWGDEQKSAATSKAKFKTPGFILSALGTR